MDQLYYLSTDLDVFDITNFFESRRTQFKQVCDPLTRKNSEDSRRSKKNLLNCIICPEFNIWCKLRSLEQIIITKGVISISSIPCRLCNVLVVDTTDPGLNRGLDVLFYIDFGATPAQCLTVIAFPTTSSFLLYHKLRFFGVLLKKFYWIFKTIWSRSQTFSPL